MYCESELCIHNKDFSCTHEDVKLDTRGICYDFSELAMPKEVLYLLRERNLKRLEIMRQKSDLEG